MIPSSGAPPTAPLTLFSNRRCVMVSRSGGAGASTYMPESGDLAEIVDFVAVLDAKGIAVPRLSPALVDADGHRVMLADRLVYQDRSRDDRRAALSEMVREGEAAGMYDLDPTPVAR